MNPIRRAISEVTSWFRPVRVDGAPGGYQCSAAGEVTANGPQFGVEIFNDAETPMEFVVGVLQSELRMPYDAAVAAMLHIHNKGSVLLPTEDLARAECAANAISTQARINGHALACRAASAQQSNASTVSRRSVKPARA
jgi:ATP-dependent Clp protease adapter protein ClpS